MPDFAGAFTTHLLSHCLATESALVDHLFASVEQRLRRVLWKLATLRGKQDQTGIISNVTQQMLADMVGTTRPRVNHLLNKLRNLGLIDYGGTLRRGDIRVRPGLRPRQDDEPVRDAIRMSARPRGSRPAGSEKNDARQKRLKYE
jgi:hypothetical protein